MDKFVKKRCESSTSSASKKTRLYNDSYLNYGFTSFDGKPQCVVCSQVLSDESMKPSKLIRHLETKHPAHKNKPLEFFESKLHTLRNQQTSMCNLSHTDKSLLEASYLVALRVAKMSKPHTIAETLVLPAAIDMVSVVIGVEEANKLKKVPLSNDTISRRIDDMAADVRDQIIEQVSSSEFFSIQFDESTDVANMSQFLCFVRYECGTSVKENMLFCKTVPGHATGKCLFDIFYEATRNYTTIDWTKCIAVCSDGAKAITGKNSGLIKILKERLTPRAEWTHCFLHRHALASKNMPENLNDILCKAVKLVNFIKSRPLQNRLFTKLCDEMGENKKSLLFHTEVRWLSRGKVLTRVLELRDELIMFLQDKQTPLSLFLQDTESCLLLAYLADIFSHLNDLNVNLQGRDKNILLMTDKVHAFIKKLDIWIIRLQSKIFDSFPLTSDYIEKHLIEKEQDTIIQHSLGCMKMHLRELKTQLTEYFPEDKNDFSKRWVLNPFSENVVAAAKLPVEIHDQLIEMSADKTLQLQFASEDLNMFWLARRHQYGTLVTEALKILIPFATSYLCEKGFSSMVALKTKYRNRMLSLENNLLLSVSNEDPRMKKILSGKQMQPSH